MKGDERDDEDERLDFTVDGDESGDSFFTYLRDKRRRFLRVRRRFSLRPSGDALALSLHKNNDDELDATNALRS